jgi:hypothetical protein
VPYIWDYRQDRGVKEAIRGRVFPLLVVARKLHRREMALDRGHGHRGVPPWRAEVIVKGVVLDICVACVVLSQTSVVTPFTIHRLVVAGPALTLW